MKIKVGNTEFDWTQKHSIIAAAVGVVLLAVLFGGGPATGPGGGSADQPPASYPVGNGIQLTPQQHQQVDLAARGAMLFVFFHEAGHMMIRELKLPAVGPEEDNADEFAAFILSDMLKAAPENEKELYAQVLYDGALYWKLAAARQNPGDIQWSDEHSPSAKRYFNILCIATGADPLRFIPMAVRDGVDENRLRRCADDYVRKHEAWNQLLDPHGRSWLSTGGRLNLKVEDPMKPEWLPFQQTYLYGGFFQALLDAVNSVTEMPQDVPVIVKGCGVLNAWWSDDTKTITLCHDFFAHLVDTFAQAVAAQNGGGGAPPQQLPPAGGAPQGAQALVGTWQCQVATPTGAATETDTYLANGELSIHSQWQNGTVMNAQGTWALQGPNTLRVVVTSSDTGMPMPMTFVSTFQMPSPTEMVTQASTCRKVG